MEDREKELGKLDSSKRLSRSLAVVGDQENELRERDIELFTAAVRSQNAPLVSLGQTLILWHPNAHVLRSMVEDGRTAFKKMAGASCLVENQDTTNLFMASAPGNGHQNYRWLLMPAEQGCAYLNWTTLYRSADVGIPLCDRNRNPLLVELWNDKVDNQNAIVLGAQWKWEDFYGLCGNNGSF